VVGDPDETMIVTVDDAGTTVPIGGSVPITAPAGTVVLTWSVRLVCKPSACSVATAPP
jgi:hypothetical protein